MTQDIIFILFYVILFIFQSEETTGMSLRKGDASDLENKCERCDGDPRKGKKETRRNFSKEKKSKYFQKLNDNFYKYKFAGRQTYNYSLSKGWGAAGMPFNVLYIPNAYQQKILKSVPRGKYSEPKKIVPEIYNLLLEYESPRGKAKESPTRNSPRKYYSLIPQLFVSYGW